MIARLDLPPPLISRTRRRCSWRMRRRCLRRLYLHLRRGVQRRHRSRWSARRPPQLNSSVFCTCVFHKLVTAPAAAPPAIAQPMLPAPAAAKRHPPVTRTPATAPEISPDSYRPTCRWPCPRSRPFSTRRPATTGPTDPTTSADCCRSRRRR